ncbi:PaaI family thioesterase [Teichococcus rhizosphaerae]|nr:PaaI family thioesterase [Pseudoroseomonas rhizosphaerae]
MPPPGADISMPASAIDADAFDPAAAGWKPRGNSSFSSLVGPLWARREGESWAYGFLAGPQHTNAHGIVHGGMLVTLADNALGLVVHEASGGQSAVTMQLNTHFLSAAHPGEFVEARGEVMRRGRSVMFVRGTLMAGGRMVLAADGIWKLLGPR